MVKNQKLNQYSDLPKNNLNTKLSKCQLKHQMTKRLCGLYYKCVMIVIDAPSVVKVMLQIVASLMIIIDDAS